VLLKTSEALISLRCSGVRVLTVACVPTGAKTGVRRSPCGVEKMPVRARSFLEVIWNWNIELIIQDETPLQALPGIASVSMNIFFHLILLAVRACG
jgi:hypothetical protein